MIMSRTIDIEHSSRLAGGRGRAGPSCGREIGRRGVWVGCPVPPGLGALPDSGILPGTTPGGFAGPRRRVVGTCVVEGRHLASGADDHVYTRAGPQLPPMVTQCAMEEVTHTLKFSLSLDFESF